MLPCNKKYISKFSQDIVWENVEKRSNLHFVKIRKNGVNVMIDTWQFF